MIGVGERQYIIDCVENGMRGDGRGREEYRPVSVEAGIIAQATGSARVWLGETDVVVGVKVELGEPLESHPDCGRFEFLVDLSSCGTSDFEGRESEDKGGEMARFLNRMWQVGPDGKACGVDLKPLSVVSGKSCLVVYVDAMVLNSDGNVLDAISFGTRVALSDMPIPHVEVSYEEGSSIPEIEVDDDPERCLRLDTSASPVIVTIGQIGRKCVTDMTAAEESCSDVALQVAVNAKGHQCGMTKSGGRPLHAALVQDMAELAQRIGPSLLRSLDAHLADVMEE